MNELANQFLDCIKSALKPLQRRLDSLEAKALKADSDLADMDARGFITRDEAFEIADNSHGKASAFAMDQIAIRDKSIAALTSEVAELKQAIESMPVPKDGKDAEPVSLTDVSLALEGMRDDLVAEARNAATEQAKSQAIDIDDVIEVIENGFIAKWALDFERRAQDTLQRAIDKVPVPKDGKDGADGKDGKDGVGHDDMTLEHDGEGGVTLKFHKGENVKEQFIQLPCMIDKGVFRESKDYRLGNVVTYGGSMWIAQKSDPQGKPGTAGSDWRLSVKKGRDGKDGRNGKDGERGMQGRDASILDMVKPEPNR